MTAEGSPDFGEEATVVSILDLPEGSPDFGEEATVVSILEFQLKPHREVIDAALCATRAGDAGALLESPVLAALKAVRELSFPDYARIRQQIKALKTVPLIMLEEQFIGGKCSPPPETTADRLVSLVEDGSELFHDKSRVPFISFEHDSHRETWALRSSGFAEWLGAEYYKEEAVAPCEQSIKTAVLTLSGKAIFAGPEEHVWLRVAKHEDRYYLDLCNDKWQAVEISADGWQVVDRPPVRFRRGKSMQPLPIPENAGEDGLSRLWDFVNIQEEDRPFLVAALLEMLRPETDFVILELIGEQGSGKSDTQERIRDLIDPSVVGLRAAPKEREHVFVGAWNNWIVSYNNLSRLAPELQDSLCTLATGGGFAARTLYSDADETVIEAKRPLLLNGISGLVTAQDLIDRTLRFDLPEIPEEQRRAKSEMLVDFEAARPVILGGLLDLFVATLRELPNVKIDRLPRMADFAFLGEAMFRAAGSEQSFTGLYRERRASAALAGLDSSPVASAVLTYLSSQTGFRGYEGTIKKLMEVLSPFKHDGDGWPKSAKGLADALRRFAPALRLSGITVKFEGHQRDGHHVTIKRELF